MKVLGREETEYDERTEEQGNGSVLAPVRCRPIWAVWQALCYMAPEQAFGRTEEVGKATDIYTFGAILYETLVAFHRTGASPQKRSWKKSK